MTNGGVNNSGGGGSGWGSAPSGSNAGSSSGWGVAPPPNPTATAAWGTPVEESHGGPKNSNSIPAASTASTASSAIVSVPAGIVGAPSAPQTGTSWAAAAGKGLPSTNSNPSGTSSNSSGSSMAASKQLEQLNSVREALFSQDGWGGGQVKQDTAWDAPDVRASSNSQEQGVNQRNSVTSPTQSSSNDIPGSRHMNNQRNDGTDLWKSTLYGPSPAVNTAKAQNKPPWGQSPQNPTDFKIWGEDEENQCNSSPHSNNEGLWRSDQPMGRSEQSVAQLGKQEFHTLIV